LNIHSIYYTLALVVYRQRGWGVVGFFYKAKQKKRKNKVLLEFNIYRF